MPLALRTLGVEQGARLCSVQPQLNSQGHPPAPSRPFPSRFVHHSFDSGVTQKKVSGWPPGFETQCRGPCRVSCTHFPDLIFLFKAAHGAVEAQGEQTHPVQSRRSPSEPGAVCSPWGSGACLSPEPWPLAAVRAAFQAQGPGLSGQQPVRLLRKAGKCICDRASLSVNT